MAPARPPAALIRLVITSALTSSLSAGCFYSSTWGARKAAQQHNAVAATPAALSAPAAERTADPAPSSSAHAPLRVRVHAAQAYAAQTPDWKAHFGSLLAQAGGVLEASAGVGLVVDQADSWDHATAAHLDGDLAALRIEDAGDGVNLVVGLVGGLPLGTEDFEQLGLSEVRGKHLVLRAPNVASEYDAIEKAFSELGARERARLRQERIRHREVAVLLHEVGHALGAEHVTAAGSLMRPRYDPKMSAFDGESVERMKSRLARAEVGDAGGPQVAAATAAAGDTANAASTANATTHQPPAKDNTPAELVAADRDRWRHASELAKAGDAETAWTTAKPLFARYKAVYEVQDLRCKLAMSRFATYTEARPECDDLMKATLAGAAARDGG